MIKFNKNERAEAPDWSKFDNHRFYIELVEGENYTLKQSTLLCRVESKLTENVEGQCYITFTNDDFVNLYNNHFDTHMDRTVEVSLLLGYSGDFRDEIFT